MVVQASEQQREHQADREQWLHDGQRSEVQGHQLQAYANYVEGDSPEPEAVDNRRAHECGEPARVQRLGIRSIPGADVLERTGHGEGQRRSQARQDHPDMRHRLFPGDVGSPYSGTTRAPDQRSAADLWGDDLVAVAEGARR